MPKIPAKYKLIGAGVLALLILIVILQNTENVQTEILFFSFSMPRALLLFFATFIGFLIGLFTSVVTLRDG